VCARRVEELAAEQGCRPIIWSQILIELKAKHIVKSQRGKEGGYLLARAPAEISMGDILRAIHGQVFDSPALSEAQCPSELRGAWKKLQKPWKTPLTISPSSNCSTKALTRRRCITSEIRREGQRFLFYFSSSLSFAGSAVGG